jgi:hypothetical protein
MKTALITGCLFDLAPIQASARRNIEGNCLLLSTSIFLTGDLGE